MRDFGKSLEGLEIGYFDNEGLSSRLKDFLEHKLKDVLEDDFYKASSDSFAEGLLRERRNQINNVNRVLTVFWPNLDKELDQSIVIYPDLKSRDKGRKGRVAMRMGKAIRKMFPVLTDSEVEALVNDIRDNLIDRKYYLKQSGDADKFKHAYAGEHSTYMDLCTSSCIKHLANSCMRYSFSNQAKHPAEAYASGDFVVYWVEDAEGKVAARSVVAIAKQGVLMVPKAAPIYAVSNQAKNIILDEFSKVGIEFASYRDWLDCSLKAHSTSPHSNDAFYAPYIDIEPRTLYYKAEIKALVVSRHGDIDGSVYSGILSAEDITSCDHCGDHIRGDNYYFQDQTLCESCHDELTFFCDHCSEYESSEGQVEVNYSSRFGTRSEYWCEYCAREHSIGCTDGSLWRSEDVFESEDGDILSPTTYEEEYFTCVLSDRIYPNDQAHFLDSGEMVHPSSITYHNSRATDYLYAFDTDSCVWVEQKINSEEQASA